MAMVGCAVLWVCCLPVACVVGQQDAINGVVQVGPDAYNFDGSIVTSQEYRSIVGISGVMYSMLSIIPLWVALGVLIAIYALAKPSR